MWANADIDEVKSLWIEKLGGFCAADISFALSALEEKKYPPNLPEFLEACRRAPRFEAMRNQSGPSKTEALALIGKIAKRTGVKFEPKKVGRLAWAHKIIERSKHEHVHSYSLKFAQETIREMQIIHPDEEAA